MGTLIITTKNSKIATKCLSKYDDRDDKSVKVYDDHGSLISEPIFHTTDNVTLPNSI